MALTSPQYVEALLGRSLSMTETTYVGTLLQMASDAVVSATTQQFAQVTAETVTLTIENGELWWPQRPVTHVEAVVVDPLGAAVPLNVTQFDWDGQMLRLSRYPYQVDPFRSPMSTPAIRDLHNFSGRVAVTVDHGYNPIPGDVQQAVASAVATLLKHQQVNPNGVRRYAEGLDGYTTDTEFYWRNEPETAITIDPDILAGLVARYGMAGYSPRVAP